MKLSIVEVQNHILEIMKVTIEICNRNNITYYTQAGTVLGVIRHGGFIPWDHDADLIIPNNEIDRFAEVMERELPDKYVIDYFKVDKKTMRQFPRIGIKGHSTNLLHLDIFRLIGLPDEREAQLSMVSEARGYTQNLALMRFSIPKLIAKGKFKHAFMKLIGKKYYYIDLFDDLCNRYDYSKANYVMNPSGKYKEKNIFKKEVYGEGLLRDFSGLEVRIPSEYDFYLKQYYGDYMEYPSQKEIDDAMNRIYYVE